MSADTPPPEDEAPMLYTVRALICDLCLDGDGDECHSPGCLFWAWPVKKGLREVCEVQSKRHCTGCSSVRVCKVWDAAICWLPVDRLEHPRVQSDLGHALARACLYFEPHRSDREDGDSQSGGAIYTESGVKLGSRIRARRQGLRWTMDELALRSGNGVDAIARWERNEQEPGARRLLSVAQALGVTMEYLLLG